MVRGQILIISKEHLRCYGEAPAEGLTELDECVGDGPTVSARHLSDGSVGLGERCFRPIRVYHAHLHLLPVPITGIPAVLNGRHDVCGIQGWQEVRAHFERHGNYRYMEFDGGPPADRRS